MLHLGEYAAISCHTRIISWLLCGAGAPLSLRCIWLIIIIIVIIIYQCSCNKPRREVYNLLLYGSFYSTEALFNGGAEEKGNSPAIV